MPTKNSKNRSRIIHIIGDANLSGVPRHILQLVDILPDFEQVVIGPDGPVAAELAGRGIKYCVVPMRGKFDLRAMASIRRHVSTLSNIARPVIVHTHGVRAGLLGRLAVRSLALPTLYTEHSWTADYHLPNIWNERFQLFLLRFLDRYSIKTIAVSKAVADFLLAARISALEKIVTIPHGISMPAKPLPLADTLVIGSVGSLTWQKNYGWLIDLIPELRRQIPSIRLEIIGDGPQRRELTRQIEENDLGDAVTLLGALNSEEIEKRFASWALYVQPSVAESFGLAAAEAVAAGLPVLVSDRGSLPEIVGTKNAVFGIGHKEKDRQKTVAIIARLVKNAAERLELRQAERAHIARYTLPDMAVAYRKLYGDLVG